MQMIGKKRKHMMLAALVVSVMLLVTFSALFASNTAHVQALADDDAALTVEVQNAATDEVEQTTTYSSSQLTELAASNTDTENYYVIDKSTGEVDVVSTSSYVTAEQLLESCSVWTQTDAFWVDITSSDGTVVDGSTLCTYDRLFNSNYESGFYCPTFTRSETNYSKLTCTMSVCHTGDFKSTRAYVPAVLALSYASTEVSVGEAASVAQTANETATKTSALRWLQGAGGSFDYHSAVPSITICPSDVTKITVAVAQSIADATVSVSSQAYTGSVIKPEPEVTLGSTTLEKGSDYTLSYSNNTDIGTATVKVTGIGDYTGTTSATFAIEAASISEADLTLENTSYTYDATEHEPSVTVVLGSATLELNTDYTLEYINNINAGTATVTLTGQGNYTGTISANFYIAKASQILKARVAKKVYKFKKLKKTKQTFKIKTSGSKIGKLTYKLTRGKKKWVSLTKAGKVTLKRHAKKGVYKFKVSASGDANHKSASATVSIRVK